MGRQLECCLFKKLILAWNYLHIQASLTPSIYLRDDSGNCSITWFEGAVTDLNASLYYRNSFQTALAQKCDLVFKNDSVCALHQLKWMFSRKITCVRLTNFTTNHLLHNSEPKSNAEKFVLMNY